ncbi:MAG: hypothetical protein ACLTSJ_09935 [Alistipes communis]
MSPLRQALEEQFGDRVTFAEKPSKEQFAAADVVLMAWDARRRHQTSVNAPSSAEKLVAGRRGQSPHRRAGNSSSGIRMTGWADKAAAILYGWYRDRTDSAIAKVLAGS